MNGTVIYLESQNGKKNKAILSSTVGTNVLRNVYDWGRDGDESPSGMDGFGLFDYFDKLFGKENYDRIVVLVDDEIWKVRKRVRSLKLGFKEVIVMESDKGNVVVDAR